tara:strand:+ start:1437 stop:2039 length:603 start_codon:yes stop_codon:yes gene_type:complete
MDNLETGDLLLFTERSKGLFGLFVSMIQWGTHSNYTHVAVVIKDPDFIDPPLKGTYIWESSWEGKPDPQDGKIKLGVQITPIEEITQAYKKIGHIFLRKLITNKTFNTETLRRIHSVVYDKPYDIVPMDWIRAFLQKDPTPQNTKRFWCSALAGYIYTQCGILDADTDWTILRPCDFALSSEHLNFTEGSSLSETETKLQ